MGLYHLVNLAFDILRALIIIHILLSWFPNTRNDFTRLVNSIVNPMLKPFKVMIPIGISYLDLSPIIVLILISVARSVVIGLIF